MPKLLEMCNLSVKSVSDKSIHQKLNISNDRGLSLDDKTKDYVDRNTGGQVYS